MITDKQSCMKNNIIRLFTKPKKWNAKGNMEFDELFSLCSDHPAIGEDEVVSRHSFWYAEYLSVKRAQVVLINVMALLVAALAMWFVLYNAIVLCITSTMLIAVATGLTLTMQRAEIIEDTMRSCYAYLFHEVLHPTDFEISDELVAAFEHFCEKEHKEKAIEDKKFRRMITGFGYSISTIAN